MVAAGIVLLLAGCGGGDSEPSEALAPVVKAPAGLSAQARAIAEAGGRQLAEDVRAGRADSVADRFDLEAFVRGVCADTGCTASVRGEFQQGFETGLAQRPGGLMSNYMSEDFRFLRLVEVDGTTQMLFRAWQEEAGVDYLRCAFDKADAKYWRIVDVFSFAGGEPFTESVRRTYLPVLAGGDKAEELRARFEPLGKVVEHLEAGDPRAARSALLGLPDSLRGQRFAQVLELQALSQIDEAADDYAAAVEAFEQAFPDDPSLPLRMLEVHSIRGEYEQALRRVDQVETLLGGDPFLHFLRAGALAGLERHAEAVKGLKLAVETEPEIEALRWALVHAALVAEDFGAVAETLRALRREFDYQLGADELRGADEYQEFVASEPGEALLAELPASAAPDGREGGLEGRAGR